MLTASRRRPADERGATIVLVALLVVGLLVMAGLVLDFGVVRSDKQSNKSATDFASAAGIRGLDVGDGIPRPFRGVCKAYEYLKANRPEMADLGGPLRDGGGATSFPTNGGSPCDPTDPTILDTQCAANTPSTWAWFDGTADGGRIEVDIKSGYLLPDPAFSTDSSTTDNGSAAQGGCDHLAVIVKETQQTGFGVLAGRDTLESTVRSVSRAVIGNKGSAAVALVILEQRECRSLDIKGGGNAGEIVVTGTGNRPGIIHSDSAGVDGPTCFPADQPALHAIEGRNHVNVPLVRAEPAPGDPTIHGIIATYADTLGREGTSTWTGQRASSTVWMCGAQASCSTGPSGALQVTRSPGDDRYHAAVALRHTAGTALFDQVRTNNVPIYDVVSNPSGWVRYTSVGGVCGGANGTSLTLTPAEIPSGRLYFDCGNGGVSFGNGQSLRITVPGVEVLSSGKVDLSSGSSVTIDDPRKIWIRGQTTGGNTNTHVGLVSKGTLVVNRAAEASCLDRQTAQPLATTEIVVGNGSVEAGAQGSAHLCSTFILSMGRGSLADRSSSTYPAPQLNGQNGEVVVGGGGNFVWTAPNTTSEQPGVGDYDLEDLALWTETSTETNLQGGGIMQLRGVFFLPNAYPTNVGGGGAGDIDADAQFWTRRLVNNGGANLRMRANPEDTVPVPFFQDFVLVR